MLIAIALTLRFSNSLRDAVVEYARCEIVVASTKCILTLKKGIQSVLISWLRPHRGIAMDKLPIYIGFFEFIFATKHRAKALIDNLFRTILALDQRNIDELDL